MLVSRRLGKEETWDMGLPRRKLLFLDPSMGCFSHIQDPEAKLPCKVMVAHGGKTIIPELHDKNWRIRHVVLSWLLTPT